MYLDIINIPFRSFPSHFPVPSPRFHVISPKMKKPSTTALFLEGKFLKKSHDQVPVSCLTKSD